MEVRRLTEMEIAEASHLAISVFDYCLRRTIPQQDLVDGFYQYASVENLLQMMQDGRVNLWGIRVNGQLCAVSAMQTEGHITMIYVLPYFQRRGYGKRLLLEMRRYAAEENNLSQVTVNAMPAWTESYFERHGFRPMGFYPYGSRPFISLSAATIREVRYPKKPVKGVVMAGIIAGFLSLVLLFGVGFLAYYFIIH